MERRNIAKYITINNTANKILKPIVKNPIHRIIISGIITGTVIGIDIYKNHKKRLKSTKTGSQSDVTLDVYHILHQG